jgi:amino acid permease
MSLLHDISNEKLKQITDSDLVHLENIKKDRKVSFKDRWFSKIDEGSVRGSIFTLSIICIGSALLAMPKKFKTMSITVCIADIIISGCASYWTLNLLIMTSKKFKLYQFSEIACYLYGKWLSYIVDVIMMIYIFGVLIMDQILSKHTFILVYKMIGAFVYAVGGYNSDHNDLQDFYEESFWSKYPFRFPIMYAVSIFVLIPLSLLKDLAKMTFITSLGFLTITGMVLIVLIESPWYIMEHFQNQYKVDDPKTHINIWDITTGFDTNLYFFTGSASIFYAYSCHYAAYPIYKSLKNRLMYRIRKVFRRSIVIDALIYIVVGVCGYLSTPIKTPDLIIDRYQLFQSDIIMIIGKTAFIIALCAKIAAKYNSFRLSALSLFFGTSEVTQRK